MKLDIGDIVVHSPQTDNLIFVSVAVIFYILKVSESDQRCETIIINSLKGKNDSDDRISKNKLNAHMSTIIYKDDKFWKCEVIKQQNIN